MGVGEKIVNNAELEPDFFGSLAVQLRHSSNSITGISRLIGMPTTRTWNASDVLDRGPNLPPRLRGENFWASDMELLDRSYASMIGEVILQLQKLKSELAEFVLSGGKLELYLMLNGKMNVGDRLSCELLRSLAELNADLDVEVFPNFNRPLTTPSKRST